MPAPWVIKLSRAHRRRVVLLGDAGNWWEIAGLPTPWALYAPKGAASLAASYLDLSGNGNDAGVGVAPTWNNSDGWIFNGSTQHLTTTFVPDTDQSQSVLVQYTNLVGADWDCLFGMYNSVSSSMVALIPVLSASKRYYNAGAAIVASNAPASANLAFSGNQGYLNGSADGGSIGTNAGATLACYIGARNRDGSADREIAAYIQALAIYDTTLTADQVSSLAAAMAAL